MTLKSDNQNSLRELNAQAEVKNNNPITYPFGGCRKTMGKWNMEYRVITKSYPKELAELVMMYLDAGWELQGGVSMVNTQGNYSQYSQAIIRKSEKMKG